VRLHKRIFDACEWTLHSQLCVVNTQITRPRLPE
jgi:hypothetical protein